MYSYYGHSPIEQLILASAPWVPVLGVWLGGIVVAIAMLPLSQRASAFAIAGLTLLSLELFFGMMASFVLQRMMINGGVMLGGSSELYTLAFGALALGRASVRALALILLFSAVLQGRLKWPEATS